MDISDFNHSSYEEHKLIMLLKEDSEYAFQLIFDKHRNRIYSTAIKFLKSPLFAQDVVQDVFLKLWFERKTLNSEKPIEAWLYTVAKNNILNRLRKIAVEWKAVDHFKDDKFKIENNTDYKLLDGEYQQKLKQAMDQLPEQQKAVFVFSRFNKLTYDQIGQKLGISPLTVKTHLSRAVFSIKKHLSSEGILLIGLFFKYF
jgi:RNA polymerase sigma-70 factor (family 1)